MNIVTLFLPGSYEDAYLYMGRLLTLTVERSLRIFDMESIIHQIETLYPEPYPLFTWLFLRNDWISSTQFRSLLANNQIASAFISAFDLIPQDKAIELTDISPQIEHSIDISTKVILDLTIYNKRIYICSDSGLYHIDSEW